MTKSKECSKVSDKLIITWQYYYFC